MQRLLKRPGYRLYPPASPEAGALLAEQGLGPADLDRSLARLFFAGVAAPSAPVAGAGVSSALSPSADVAPVPAAAGSSSPSGSTPIAARPSLVMTTR